MDSERKLTEAEGLPSRPWFKHQIYAPGFYTGYAAKTIPAVREAIEQKQWKQAEDGIVVVAKVLEDEATLFPRRRKLERGRALAENAPPLHSLASYLPERRRRNR